MANTNLRNVRLRSLVGNDIEDIVWYGSVDSVADMAASATFNVVALAV